MLLKIIEDVNKALDNRAYFAALALVLTIPDICGRAEYPAESVGKRYIEWYDNYIGYMEKSLDEEGKMPYLSGEVVYNLRNSFLHQGTPNVSKEKIKNEQCKIDKFILVFEKKNEYDAYTDIKSYSRTFCGNDMCMETRTYEVNVRRLCLLLCTFGKRYYERNKEKFDFFDYKIIDREQQQELLEKINEKNTYNL